MTHTAPCKIDEAGVKTLRGELPSTYVVLSPYPNLPSPVVISAWGAQVQVDKPDDARIESFVQKYWKSANAPEPTAACTGGIDGPGLVS